MSNVTSCLFHLSEFAPSGNFTCRNDSSLSFPLAYLCEGPPDKYGHYRKRYAEDYYGPYDYIDCPDGSDESPETCGKNITPTNPCFLRTI